MRAALYVSIQDRLMNIAGKDNKPLFKHFDLWNNNVNFIEQETPFETPAVFVEFAPIQWNQMGLNKQNADLTIRLHCVTRWFANTAKYNPKQDDALGYLDIPELVNAALYSLAPDGGNRLMRIRSIVNHNHEQYVDTVEEYICNIIDASAVKQYTAVEVVPVVSKG